MHDAITTTAAINPITNADVFRAMVLAWTAALSLVIVAIRPLLLSIVDLIWDIRIRMESDRGAATQETVGGVVPDNPSIRKQDESK